MNYKLYEVKYNCVFIISGRALVCEKNRKNATGLLEDILAENYNCKKEDLGFKAMKVKDLGYKVNKKGIISINFNQ